MKVLVIGKSGQVAREIARHAPKARFVGRCDADLTNPAACATLVRASAADVVINAAAYTQVDRAEADTATAFAVNGTAPGAMAEAARDIGAVFVQVSTDYVFDGGGDASWRPEDAPAPLGVYGRSKLAGEEAVRASGATFAILRTSWVFSAHGQNFLKTMLRLSDERESLAVVADQIGGPTPAEDIARAVQKIGADLAADPAKAGTYHFSGAPDVSWADFARAIFVRAERQPTVIDIATEAWPTPARRPLNSRLDCRTTETTFGLIRPDWRRGIGNVLNEIGA